MRPRRSFLKNWWNSYKFRFVPWIVLNVHKNPLKKAPEPQAPSSTITGAVTGTVTGAPLTSNNNDPVPVPVSYLSSSQDHLLSNSTLISTLSSFLSQCIHPSQEDNQQDNNLSADKISSYNASIMRSVFGFQTIRSRSSISPEAGTGVFISSGKAPCGSLVALYPGTLYMPYEPLFFQSLGNPFIFRCSDGIHIDGNDKFISKSIFKSSAARDRFSFDLPCCDSSWLSPTLFNPLNIGQYVNNRTKSTENNVVYQEHFIPPPPTSTNVKESSATTTPKSSTLPIHLWKFLPNVWSNPSNNKVGLKLISLVAIRDIEEGEEILSSYFTVLHPDNDEDKLKS